MKKIFLAIITVSVGLTLISAPYAGAVTASDWKAGRIIDDAVFTNKDDMSVAEIQTFLNNRVGTGTNGTPGRCDTNGTKTSELGGGTRAQYGAANGNPAPFTCLKDYYEVPKLTPGPGIPANNYGGKPIPSGAKSAAQLIWDAAQKYNIGSRVLLIKLATESSGPLTSDDWPFQRQYTYAMGANCPDSGPNGSANCDVNYAGFSIQISQAASLLRYYLDGMTQAWWPYKKPYQNNSILWNVVERNCGSGNVYIESKATAALYTYTPYQPNQAALNNMYGTGDYCSAYGNRNFWRVYNDWFGSTQGSVQITSPLDIKTEYKQGTFTNQEVSAEFTIKNTTSLYQYLGVMAIAARDANGANFDFGSREVWLSPYSTYYYSASRTFSTESTYTFSIANYRSDFGWSESFPDSTSGYSRTVSGVKIQTVPTITQSPQAGAELRVGKATPLTFKVKNNSATSTVNLGLIGLAARSPSGSVADLPFEEVPSLAAGATYTYSKSFTPQMNGKYTFYISSTGDQGATWNETGFPAIDDGAIQRKVTLDVKPSPTQTSSVSFGEDPVRVGKTATGTFTVRNFGDSNVAVGGLALAIRGPNGENSDLPLTDVVALAGQSYTYSFSRKFDKPGTYTAWITNYRNGVWDDTTYPVKESSDIQRKITFEVKPNPTQTSSVSFGSEPLRVGKTATGALTIHNYADEAISIGSIAIAVRSPSGANKDISLQAVTIPAGSDYTYSGTTVFSEPGTYTAWLTNFRNGVWDDTSYPSKENGDIQRKITFEVKPSPTISQSVRSSVSGLRVGQATTLTFKVKNYGSSSVDLGRIGLSGRDPQGRNVDPGVASIVLSAGEERTISYVVTPSMTGNYRYEIISTTNNGVTWSNGPVIDSSSILKALTISVAP